MKGLTERRVLYGHVFRNAMLIVIAGFPGAFVGAFFAGSLLIEQVFSLDGLGYLSYDSLIQPRLSGGVRQSLYLRADRPRREPALRPHLHLDRSAHRFRDAGGVSLVAHADGRRAILDPPPQARGARRTALHSAAEDGGRLGAGESTRELGAPSLALADEPAPARQFPPQQARRSGRSGSSWSCSSLRCAPSSSPTTGR